MLPTSGEFVFGSFLLDIASRTLHRGGRPVPLQEQSARVLILLIASEGRVVDRQSMREHLWGNLAHNDPDQAINKAVNQLRAALGDTPRAGRYIQTMPRTGYRFVAPVDYRTKVPVETVALPLPPTSEEWPDIVEPSHSISVPELDRISLSTAFIPAVQPSKKAVYVFFACFVLVLVVAYAGFRHVRSPRPVTVAAPGVTLVVAPIDAVPELHTRAELLRYDLTDILGHVAGFRLPAAHLFDAGAGGTTATTLPSLLLQVKAKYVLLSELRQSGAECSLRAELIRSSDSGHVANFSVSSPQCRDSELRERAAYVLQIQLPGALQATGAGAQAIAPAAYESYLQGVHELNKRSDQSLNRAMQMFQQAIKQQPGYAAAYAGMANVYLLLADHDGIYQGFAMAERLAHRALELDPSLAMAHGVLGCTALSIGLNWPAAERELKLASDLAPDEAVFPVWLASFYSAQGKDELALYYVQAAQRNDPYWPPVYQVGVLVNRNAGKPDAMLRNAQMLQRLAPNWPASYRTLADAEWQIHRYSEAVRNRTRAAELSGDTGALQNEVAAAALFQKAGPVAYAAAELHHLLLPSADPQDGSLEAAQWAAFAQQPDVAIRILKALVEKHDPEAVQIASDPSFASLRNDTRFRAVENRVLNGSSELGLSAMPSLPVYPAVPVGISSKNGPAFLAKGIALQ